VLISFNCSDEHPPNQIQLENKQSDLTTRTHESGGSEITIINNRIAFDDKEHFNSVNWHLLGLTSPQSTTFEDYLTPSEILDDWESDIEYTSYRREYIESTGSNSKDFDIDNLSIPEPVLATLVNPQKIVQVGPWIFKLETNSRQVFALNTENIHLLPVLEDNNEFEDYPQIRVFSFEDDVFESLENEGEEQFNWPCLQRYASNNHDPTDEDPYCKNEDTEYKFEFEVRYSRWGIIENLFGRLKHRDDQPWRGGTGDMTFYDLAFTGSYTPRCEDTVGFNRDFTTLCTNTNDISLPFLGGRNAMYPIYSESKALSAYFLGGEVRFYNRCTNFPVIAGITVIDGPGSGVCTASWRVIESNYVEISDN